MKFNIVFTVGGRQGMEYDDDDGMDFGEDYDDGWVTDDENEEVIIDTEDESDSDHEPKTRGETKSNAFKKLKTLI